MLASDLLGVESTSITGIPLETFTLENKCFSGLSPAQERSAMCDSGVESIIVMLPGRESCPSATVEAVGSVMDMRLMFREPLGFSVALRSASLGPRALSFILVCKVTVSIAVERNADLCHWDVGSISMNFGTLIGGLTRGM